MTAEKQNNRWWEFYFVRYGMSTVVGTVMVYVLLSTDDTLRSLLFLPNYGNIEMANIVLLGAYGLAFCYIASAPVLTFYAARFYLDGRAIQFGFFVDTWRDGKLYLLLFVIVCGMCVGSYFLAHQDFSVMPWWIVLSIYAVFFFFAFLQATFVRHIFLEGNTFYTTYLELAKKRVKVGPNFTDSYRHLREHGNSFCIVLCEVLLAVILYMGFFAGLPKLSAPLTQGILPILTFNFGMILAIWTIPAAAIWLVGIRLERQMIEDNSINTGP